MVNDHACISLKGFHMMHFLAATFLLFSVALNPVDQNPDDPNPGFANPATEETASASVVYKDPTVSIDKRVDALLKSMTLEEKFWQLFMIPGDLSQGKDRFEQGIFGLQVSTKARSEGDAEQMMEYAGGGSARAMAEKINETQRFFLEETRLGIPIIPFDEALHGLVREGATAFPQAIGLAATWNTELMGKAADAIATEVRTRGIRQILSPVVNLARDVRWGRVEETYGEDPCLTVAMGVAFISAFENQGVVTTPKHFAVNVGDGGRDSYPVHPSERQLREVYFPGFKACFHEGGARSVMTAYNALDGSPCTASDWLLNTILKEEWGFKGFVISDAGAVGGLLDLHHTATSREDSAAKAIINGLDVIFQTAYDHHVPLLEAFKEGRIPVETIDAAVARVLRAKFELGLFEDPYVDPEEAAKVNRCEAHQQLALQAARESIVLLKNESRLLPLSEEINSIAVIGTDAKEARLGGYSGPGTGKICLFEGLKRRLPKGTILKYAEGCGREEPRLQTIPQDCLYHSDRGESRQGLKGAYHDRTDLLSMPVFTRVDPEVQFKWTLFPPHPSLALDEYSIRWTGKLKVPQTNAYEIGIEGNDGYRLFIDGERVIDRWTKQTTQTTTVTRLFEKDREYDLRVEFYENRGNGQISLVWDHGSDKGHKARIDEAVRLAFESEVVVVAAGIEEGEFRDRANIRLPGLQEEMIRKLASTRTPTIVILFGGSAIDMTTWIDEVDAALFAWYPGEAGGIALADILFGDFNPGGRLPITFPRSVAQVPLYYNHKATGRGDDYIDMTGAPMFPFGFGLSYTNFKYRDLTITPDRIGVEEKAVVQVSVTNTGLCQGDEVVQLYLRDRAASVARPVIELIDFRRISLEPNETQRVSFEVSAERLSLLDKDLNRVIEPGAFIFMVGASSRDIRLRGTLLVK